MQVHQEELATFGGLFTAVTFPPVVGDPVQWRRLMRELRAPRPADSRA